MEEPSVRSPPEGVSIDTAPSSGPERPRLCFVGPNLGSNRDWVVSQAEILSGLFERQGYPTRSTSSFRQPVLRLADILGSLARWRREIDLGILAIVGGGGFGACDAASLQARRLGLPLVHFLHGGALPDFARRNPSWTRRVLARADAIVAPSTYLTDLASSLGLAARVIPNVLQLESYPFRCRQRLAPRLLWVRTFHQIYNPRLALATLRELRNSGVEAELTMAGQDKGELEAMRRHAAEIGLADRVRFPGFLDMEAKQREFAAHDIFLNTNRIDNMPVTVIEAAAFGLPIVATRVGGIPDLLRHEYSGLLVDDDDSAQMAAAVRRLIASQELSRKLSEGGRALAESCAWPAVHDRWRQLFAELLPSAGHKQQEHCW